MLNMANVKYNTIELKRHLSPRSLSSLMDMENNDRRLRNKKATNESNATGDRAHTCVSTPHAYGAKTTGLNIHSATQQTRPTKNRKSPPYRAYSDTLR